MLWREDVYQVNNFETKVRLMKLSSKNLLQQIEKILRIWCKITYCSLRLREGWRISCWDETYLSFLHEFYQLQIIVGHDEWWGCLDPISYALLPQYGYNMKHFVPIREFTQLHRISTSNVPIADWMVVTNVEVTRSKWFQLIPYSQKVT